MSNFVENVFTTTRQNIKCNYLFSKIKRGDEKMIKYLRSSDEYANIEHKPDIRELLEYSGELICGGVTKGYILNTFDEADYVFVLTSIDKHEHKLRKENFIDRLCGILFIKNKTPKAYGKAKLEDDYLYLSLICGRPGVGSKLMNLFHNLAKFMGKKRVILDSLAAPIGFYLKKGYLFTDSNDPKAIAGINLSSDNNEKPNKDKLKLIEHDIDFTNLEKYLGYIHSEVRGNKKYEWILTNNKKWLYLKPGFIRLYKRIESDGIIIQKPLFNKSIINYLKKYSNPQMKYTRVKDSNGLKINEYGGIITSIHNVSTFRLDGDAFNMIKILDTAQRGGRSRKIRKSFISNKSKKKY